MNKVPYLVFLVVFFLNYVIAEFKLPGIIRWFPELVSIMLLVFLVVRAAGTKNLHIAPKYALLFGILLLHIFVGVIVNGVAEGPLIAGLRYYLKFSPLFLLPAVFNFTDTQIAGQLKFLLALGIIQLPIVLYQRFFEFARLYTGDVVSGTLGVSSILSMFLVCSIIVLLAFYLKKRISGRAAIALGFLLFIPTTLNETKGTIILLPVGLVAVILTAVRTKTERKMMLGAIAAFSVLGFIFVAIYDQMYDKVNSGEGLVSFFSGEGVEEYLYNGVEFDPQILDQNKGKKIITTNLAEDLPKQARLDRLFAPVAILQHQPAKLLFGLGIGNVSVFKFSDYQGQYAYIGQQFHIENIMLSQLVWELGIGGALIYFLFFYFVYSDARNVSKQDNISGWLATAWIGVIAIVIVAVPYKNIFGFNVIGYLFFYLSGIIAAAACRTSLVVRNNKALSGGDSGYFVSPLTSHKPDL